GFVLGHRFDRCTGGHQTQHRQVRAGRAVVGQLDRAGELPFPSDQALLFQGLEVAHDSVGRDDVEFVADFADRRAIAAVLDLVLDEVVNVALTLRENVQIRHVGLLLEVSQFEVASLALRVGVGTLTRSASEDLPNQPTALLWDKSCVSTVYPSIFDTCTLIKAGNLAASRDFWCENGVFWLIWLNHGA